MKIEGGEEADIQEELGREFPFLKVEFYDRKGSLLKTLSFSDYKQYLNQYWRAHTMAMTNHQTGKSTELTTSEMRFNTGLEDNDFPKNVLKRVR